VKRYDAVVFDWDGTIMDSTHSIVAAIQAACADLMLPVPPPEDASWVIGLSFDTALRRIAPTLTQDRMPRFLERFRAHFLLRDPEIALFSGILDVFADLRARHIQLGVATGKGRAGLDRALSATQLQDCFESTRCADESFSKPHPAMLLEIMEELSLRPERVLMVGDTTHDVQMAGNAGVDSMAVSYGAHDKDTLAAARPTVLVSSVGEMRAWLAGRA
jgi:phosphoglycolate phosphatase